LTTVCWALLLGKPPRHGGSEAHRQFAHRPLDLERRLAKRINRPALGHLRARRGCCRSRGGAVEAFHGRGTGRGCPAMTAAARNCQCCRRCPCCRAGWAYPTTPDALRYSKPAVSPGTCRSRCCVNREVLPGVGRTVASSTAHVGPPGSRPRGACPRGAPLRCFETAGLIAGAGAVERSRGTELASGEPRRCSGCAGGYWMAETHVTMKRPGRRSQGGTPSPKHDGPDLARVGLRRITGAASRSGNSVHL